MTPAEKAIELYGKYLGLTDDYNVKYCALIAVDALISEIENAYDEYGLWRLEYWQLVRYHLITL